MLKNDPAEVLACLVKEYLRKQKVDKRSLCEVYLDFPPEEEFGDLSLSIALKLARDFKKPPREIAESILAYLNREIKNTAIKNDIESMRIAGGGFINFFLAPNYFSRVIKEIIKRGDDFGRSRFGKRKKILVEFVSANPTGTLSVAHARQAAVGDSLCNILEFIGFNVKREYYINDEGNQIKLLGESIAARLRQLQGVPQELPPGGYAGETICDIAKEILGRPGKAEENNAYFSEYGVSYILKIIKQELKDFGVAFDCWYSQKQMAKSACIERVIRRLRDKGVIYDKEGAIWFKSSSYGDDKDRVVKKSDASYTYLAPDIAYHQDKYRRGFHRLINLWGPDHHGYISRLKAAVQALGKDADSLTIIIVQLVTIFRGNQPLPMSTRKGQYISLREILDEVGPEASRFFFLMRRTSAHLDFDLELAKSQTPENPVYYVQYAYARICSILRKAHPAAKRSPAGLSLLKQAEELRVMRKLWQFPSVLQNCYKNNDPFFITVYLQEIAVLLHRFYEQHRVLGEDAGLSAARIALISAAASVIKNGLRLLGISAPEKM